MIRNKCQPFFSHINCQLTPKTVFKSLVAKCWQKFGPADLESEIAAKNSPASKSRGAAPRAGCGDVRACGPTDTKHTHSHTRDTANSVRQRGGGTEGQSLNAKQRRVWRAMRLRRERTTLCVAIAAGSSWLRALRPPLLAACAPRSTPSDRSERLPADRHTTRFDPTP